LEGLEEEQKKTRDSLMDLSKALEAVETSLDGNRDVVKGNVKALEERVEGLLSRLDEIGKGE
jgi:nuclear migration protein JNM1